jgi:UDPglucose 6-dehydrogenase
MAIYNGIYNENVVCIGWGVVGQATSYALGITNYIDKNVAVYGGYKTIRDKNSNEEWNLEEFKNASCYILCLPTPTIKGKQHALDIFEWLAWIELYNPNVLVIIRSTLLPGTIAKYIKEFKLKIVYIPEFLNEATSLEDTMEPELFVMGQSRDIYANQKAKIIFSPIIEKAKHKIFCSPTTAEVIKYAMNSFFALKVVYGNQLWNMCREAGADYAGVREALENHKWGSKNGWDVWHRGKRGYSGACLPKDVEALVDFFDMPLLKEMQKINKKLLNESQK